MLAYVLTHKFISFATFKGSIPKFLIYLETILAYSCLFFVFFFFSFPPQWRASMESLMSFNERDWRGGWRHDRSRADFVYCFLYMYNFIYLFIFGSTGSLLLHSLFSSCGAQALGHMGFSSCGSRVLELRLEPGLVVHGLSCSMACGIFPNQGSNPCLLNWQADSLPLSHKGGPPFFLVGDIYLVIPRLSCSTQDIQSLLQYAGSSSLIRDWTQPSYIGSMES